jgi:ectoine hydroxylase-related dioxygenase (phytanoyl-CoA dioxygenase family)
MRGLDELIEVMATRGCAHTPAIADAALCEAVVDAWLDGPSSTTESLRRQHTGRFETHLMTADGFVANPLLSPHTLEQWPRLASACQAVLDSPRLLAAVEALLGPEARLHQSAFYDSGLGSTPHRDDHPLRPDGPMVAVLVALEPISPEGGPLVVWPGTHAIDDPTLDAQGLDLFRRQHLEGDLEGDLAPDLFEALARRIQGHLEGREQALATFPTGDGMWWWRRTLHGSYAPVPGARRTRRSLIAHFMVP